MGWWGCSGRGWGRGLERRAWASVPLPHAAPAPPNRHPRPWAGDHRPHPNRVTSPVPPVDRRPPPATRPVIPPPRQRNRQCQGRPLVPGAGPGPPDRDRPRQPRRPGRGHRMQNRGGTGLGLGRFRLRRVRWFRGRHPRRCLLCQPSGDPVAEGGVGGGGVNALAHQPTGHAQHAHESGQAPPGIAIHPMLRMRRGARRRAGLRPGAGAFAAMEAAPSVPHRGLPARQALPGACAAAGQGRQVPAGVAVPQGRRRFGRGGNGLSVGVGRGGFLTGHGVRP